MKQTTLVARWALMLVMVGALALAGCGGDDGNSISVEDQARIDKLTADLSAAEKAKEGAEAAAKQAQTDAEMAQAEAEVERDAANTAKGAAEAAKATAEAAQTEAETAQTEAETAQAMADTAKAAAEVAQAAAEQAQMEAEADRDTTEALRAAAEKTKMEADAARMTAEEAQRMAVAAQATAESERDTANQAKTDAEVAEAGAKQAQMDAEAAQAVAETARDAALTAQATAEAERDVALAAQGDAGEALAAAQEAQGMAEAAEEEAKQAQMDAETAQMEAEAERDAANTAKGAAEANLLQAQSDLLDAQNRVGELETLIGDAVNPVAGSLTAMLAAANNKVTQLETMIGMDPSVDDPDGSGLKGELSATKMALAMKQQELDDANGMVTQLQGDLEAKEMELMAANDELDKLKAEDVTENNIERGEAIRDQIYARIDSKPGLPLDSSSSPVKSISDFGRQSDGTGAYDFKYTKPDGTEAPVSAAAVKDASIHDVAVDDGDIEVDMFTGGTSRQGDWLNATLKSTGVEDGQTIEVYADTDPGTETDLIYFGWWLNEPDVVSDPYDLSVFASGNNTLGDDGYKILKVEGKATYEGMAAGLYSAEVRTAGVRSDMDSGSFTADVELTADFGTGAEELLKISGVVDNFTVSGDVSASLWDIDLMAPSSSSLANFKTDKPYVTGEARLEIGGVRGGEGMWQGRFYRERTGVAGSLKQELAPAAIAGTFGIEDRQLAIIGAFGAHIDTTP